MATEKLNETPEALQSEIEIKMRSAGKFITEKAIAEQRDKAIIELSIEVFGKMKTKRKFPALFKSIYGYV